MLRVPNSGSSVSAAAVIMTNTLIRLVLLVQMKPLGRHAEGKHETESSSFNLNTELWSNVRMCVSGVTEVDHRAAAQTWKIWKK